MTRCRECDTDVERLDGEHLAHCCGLTLQEYALRHGIALDTLVPPDLLDAPDPPRDYPAPENPSDARALAILAALRCAGQVGAQGPFETIAGEVRTLDTLLWIGEQLAPLGFKFRQEYRSAEQGQHRVVARNLLKRPRPRVPEPTEFEDLAENDRRWFSAVLLSRCAVRREDYITLHVPEESNLRGLCRWLEGVGVDLVELDPIGPRRWFRTDTAEDTDRLLSFAHPQLHLLPHQCQRLEDDGPAALVVKEIDLDAAHFITDHPGSCANLHGGRYTVRFKVYDCIDPCSGFVMDYADLKAVVRARVAEALDHKTLNYAAPELAWRSSTELLAVWIWERLIEYLPNLEEIEIHETRTSRCQYRGPTLEQHQEYGSAEILHHFQQPRLGRSRREPGVRPHLRVVGDD